MPGFSLRWTNLLPALPVLALFLAAQGCGEEPGEGDEVLNTASAFSALTVGGCACPTSGSCSALTYSDMPSNNLYYVTTFGGGNDTQGMACGGTADGKWAYVADSARFGCGCQLTGGGPGAACLLPWLLLAAVLWRRRRARA